MATSSQSAQTLIDGFPEALRNSDKMRGWKRAMTLYAKRRSDETGTPPERFRAAIKAKLTQAGYDTTSLS
jgi:hypothetical protein